MKIVNEAVINLKAAKELGLEIPTVWGAKWPSIGFAVDNRKAWSLYFRWD